MSDRKNIKVKPDTHERLKNSKPDGTTWDGYLHHILDAYHDPRQLFPKDHISDRDEPGVAFGDILSQEEKEEVAEKARELMNEINFTELLLESEDSTEATARLIAELTADRVVEKLEEVDNA